MAVGKESIRRAATAGAAAKKTAETKAAAETKETAAKPAAKKTAGAASAKTGGTKKTGTRTASGVKKSVIASANAEEIQVTFMKGKKAADAAGRPIQVSEELPVYLL